MGLALSRVAATLDFRITVLDDRPGLNTLLINPYAHEKRTVAYDRLAREVPEGPHHYAVIMTFGYRTDAVALRQLLPLRLAYLGLMSSEAKAADMRRELRAAGYAPEQLARVHSPIGLPVHSSTPEEIAVGVAAELIRVRNTPYAAAR